MRVSETSGTECLKLNIYIKAFKLILLHLLCSKIGFKLFCLFFKPLQLACKHCMWWKAGLCCRFCSLVYKVQSERACRHQL